MRLAEKGFDVIASVEIYAQVQILKREAAARGVSLRVEKLDVTNDGDRKKAFGWDVEILVNNAGVLEGGSVVDIPAANMRRGVQANVVIGPPLLSQGIAKQTVVKRAPWGGSYGSHIPGGTGMWSTHSPGSTRRPSTLSKPSLRL